MFKRRLEDHEALLVAVHETEQDPEWLSLDVGVSLRDDLQDHPYIKPMSADAIHKAAIRAYEAGWLLCKPRIFSREEIRGLSLNSDGVTMYAALTEPWWRTHAEAFGRDLRGALVSGIVSFAVTIVSLLVLS